MAFCSLDPFAPKVCERSELSSLRQTTASGAETRNGSAVPAALENQRRIPRRSLAAAANWLGVLGALGVLAVRFLKGNHQGVKNTKITKD